MQHPGWLLIIFGLIIAGIGVIWLIAPSIPWLPLTGPFNALLADETTVIFMQNETAFFPVCCVGHNEFILANPDPMPSIW
jgi:hypothetical protein